MGRNANGSGQQLDELAILVLSPELRHSLSGGETSVLLRRPPGWFLRCDGQKAELVFGRDSQSTKLPLGRSDQIAKWAYPNFTLPLGRSSQIAKWTFPNFTTEEVACKCGCGISNMAFSTMWRFQLARFLLGRPIYGRSWCRCERHNEVVGGVEDSSHIASAVNCSHAGDVTLARVDRPMTNHERFILHTALYRAGFTRFGLHAKFIHTDDDPEKKAKRIWLY